MAHAINQDASGIRYTINTLLGGVAYPQSVVIVHRVLGSSSRHMTYRTTADWLTDHLQPRAVILLSDVPPSDGPLPPTGHSATVRIAKKITSLGVTVLGIHDLIPEQVRHQMLNLAAHEALLEQCVYSSGYTSPDLWEERGAFNEWNQAVDAGIAIVDELEGSGDSAEINQPQNPKTEASRLAKAIEDQRDKNQVVAICRWPFTSLEPLLETLKTLSPAPSVIALTSEGIGEAAQSLDALEEQFIEQASRVVSPTASDPDDQ